MEFSFLSAWVVVAVSIGALSGMSYLNQRSGWKPKKSNDLLDALMLWASASREESERRVDVTPTALRIARPEVPATVSPALTNSDLMALHTALQASIAPVPEEADNPLEISRKS